MKLYYFLFLSTFLISAQNENFSIENNYLTWKYVYNDTLNINQFKSNPRFSFSTDSTGIINKGGVNNKNIVHEYSANFKIETKENRYRVTVNNIRFYNTTQISVDMFQTTVNDYPIETSTINRKGEIKNKTWGISITDIMHEHFFELFEIKEVTKKDNGW